MERCTGMHRCAQRCGGLSETDGEKQTRAQNELKWAVALKWGHQGARGAWSCR